MSKKVAIIGAGITGLHCALNLEKQGIEYTIFEKSERAGGRFERFDVDDTYFDIGPFLFSSNNLFFMKLVKELKLYPELDKLSLSKLNLDSKQGIINLSVINMLTSRYLSFGDKIALVKFVVQQQLRFSGNHLKNLKSFENERIADNFTRAYTVHLYDMFKPILKTVNLDNPDYVMADHGLFLLQGVCGNVYVFRNGASTLTDKLRSLLEKNIRFNSDVKKVLKTNEGYVVKYCDDNGTQKTEHYDFVVACTPLSDTDFLGNLFSEKSMKYSTSYQCIIKGKLRNWDESEYRVIFFEKNKSNIDAILQKGNLFNVYGASRIGDLDKYFSSYNIIKRLHIENTLPVRRSSSGIDMEVFQNLFVCGDFIGYPSVEFCLVNSKSVSDVIVERCCA